MNKKKYILITGVAVLILILSSYFTVIQLSLRDNRFANQIFKQFTNKYVTETIFFDTFKQVPQSKNNDVLKAYGYGNEYFKVKYLWLFLYWCASVVLLISLFAYALHSTEKKSRTKILKGIAKQLEKLEDSPPLFHSYHDEGYDLLNDAIQKTIRGINHEKNNALISQRNMTRNLQDIAHQIKTPLTSMSIMTELLTESSGQTQTEIISRLENQIDRLSILTENLLKLSTLDQPQFTFKKEIIFVYPLIKKVLSSLEYLAQSKSIQFSYMIDEQATIEWDPYWSAEGLYNLLKNAIEHSVEDGIIVISHEQNPLYHEFNIDDAGSGFIKEDIPYLFNRFYRGKNAKPDSVGIGLSISKSIFEGQGGQISAHNHEGHGRFHLKQFIS